MGHRHLVRIDCRLLKHSPVLSGSQFFPVFVFESSCFIIQNEKHLFVNILNLHIVVI